MIHQKYELSTDSLELCKGKLVPGIVATWGEIVGNIENQEDLVEYISTHGGGGGGATWGSISGNIKDQTDLYNYFEDTVAWVVSQNYLKPSALNGYATESWVSSQNYLTSTALTGYATESWVSGQGYLVSTDLSQYATRQWVVGRGYLTSESLDGYATEDWVGQVALEGYATEQWVSDHGYLTSESLSGYATESWVGNQGYITSAALSGYATESWVQNQGYYQQLPGYYAIEKRILSMDPDTEDKPEDYPIDEYVDYDYLTIGYCDTGETWRFDGVRLGEEGAGIYTITPVETEVEGETVIEYQEDYDSFVTQSYLLPIEDDLGDITVRVSALETNYGDAVTTTNNILGV